MTFLIFFVLFLCTECGFEHWEKELFEKLPIKTELLTKKKPKKITIIDDLEYEWVSEHDRKINKPVTVCHIFLDCS
jgi:hypothetical protein